MDQNVVHEDLLGNEREDHNNSNDVEARVEVEYSSRSHRSQDSSKEDRQNGSPEQARCNCPSHADFSVRQWGHFGAVRGRNCVRWLLVIVQRTTEDCNIPGPSPGE